MIETILLEQLVSRLRSPSSAKGEFGKGIETGFSLAADKLEALIQEATQPEVCTPIVESPVFEEEPTAPAPVIEPVVDDQPPTTEEEPVVDSVEEKPPVEASTPEESTQEEATSSEEEPVVAEPTEPVTTQNVRKPKK